MMKLYYSQNQDPFYNHALELTLLDQVKHAETYILFYVNSPSVVMGRFQNPWMECKMHSLEEQGVKLLRRHSGGGCVYHDQGNLNFCFIHGNREIAMKENFEMVIDVLKDFNIPAYRSSRNDILVKVGEEDFKISGSAFKQKKDSSFHHATLLFNSDLNRLYHLLRPRQKNLASKSIRSHYSDVKNMIDFSEKLNIDIFIERFAKVHNLSFENDLKFNPEIAHYVEQLKSSQWLWGQTPRFTFEISQLEMDIERGNIASVEYLKNPFLNQLLKDQLIGKLFHHNKTLLDIKKLCDEEFFKEDELLIASNWEEFFD